MDWHEEQSLEVEALQSIYGDDFSEISDVPRSYQVIVEPIAGAGEEENHVAVTITVTCTESYPATDPPQLIIEPIRGLQDQHIDHLQDLADRAAVDAIGEVSVFNICEAIKEWLVDHNQPELTMHEEMEERMRLEEEEENEIEEVKARAPKPIVPSPLGIPLGTLVTSNSFADWKRRFDEEQAAIRLAAELAAGPKTESRLSGKQLFLQNLAQELEDEDSAPEDTDKKEVFWFNDDLYSKEELPDDDDDEDDAVHKPTTTTTTTTTTASKTTTTSATATTTKPATTSNTATVTSISTTLKPNTTTPAATTNTTKVAPSKAAPAPTSTSTSKPTSTSKAAPASTSTSTASSQPNKKPADNKGKSSAPAGKNAPTATAAAGKGGKKK